MGCIVSSSPSPKDPLEVYKDNNNKPTRSSNDGDSESAAKPIKIHRASTGSEKSSIRRSSEDSKDLKKLHENLSASNPPAKEDVKQIKGPVLVQRRKSLADTYNCELNLGLTEVQPFSQVEVRWKIKGFKTNEADWIGMYPGTEIPDDIDNYMSSMMASGKAEGCVKFTAPNNPGLHHFRYFLLDDTEAAVSHAFTILKLDKGETGGNIHVRDALLAENEVKRIAGKKNNDDNDDDFENLAEEHIDGEPKKKKKQQPKILNDMTGLGVDDEDSSTSKEKEMEKRKEDERRQESVKECLMMDNATNYVKKILTKKEMRAEAAKKVAGQHGTPVASSASIASAGSEEAGDGEPVKKGGWGALKSAVKIAGAFQQGRANGKSDNTLKERKLAASKESVGDMMGTVVIDRKPKK